MMFRHAISYLALSVLLSTTKSSLGITIEQNHAAVKDEIIEANKMPSVTFKKTVGKDRSLEDIINPFWTQIGQILQGSDEGDRFGIAVDQSNDGKVIAVGVGGYDSDDDQDVGKVQVYKRRTLDNGSFKWVRFGQDLDYGIEDNERIGYSLRVSFDGKTVAIGSDNYDNSTGYVKVYIWSTKRKRWLKLGNTIRGDFPGDEAGWGFDLSSDGRTLAFGMPGHDGNGKDNGLTEIYTYKKDSKTWELKGNKIPGYQKFYDETMYGFSVAISGDGDRVLMSSLFHRTEEYYDWAGAVKVFDYDSSKDKWVQVGDTIHGDEDGDEFGVSVAMSLDGDTIAVGAGCYYYCGDKYDSYVRVYYWVDGKWKMIGDLHPKISTDVKFGNSVSLSDDGERLGVAASGTEYGYARVFEHQGDTDWSQVGQDLVIEKYNTRLHRNLLSLSGDGEHLVAGAYLANKKEQGHVRAYEIATDEKKAKVAGCVDSKPKLTFKLSKGNPYVRCAWVKKKRKMFRCAKPGVASMCPLACGQCFAQACDDGELEFKNGKDCDWVAKYPKTRCNDFTSNTCRKTCETRMYVTLCKD